MPLFESDGRSTVRGLSLEALAFAVLAVAPVIPYVTLIAGRGVARFEVGGDLALMEYDVRHVWTGDTLLGLASRFRWNHPGPLLYYFAAPFERVSGNTSTGFYLATAVLSCAALGGTVVATRLLAGRVHAAAVLLVLLAWLAAFGNVAADPWPRVVIVLPLIAYFVLAALFALGHGAVAPPAVFFGLVAAETHLSTASTVAVVGAMALVSFVVRVRRGGGLDGRQWRCLAIAAGVLILACLPPAVQQLRAAHGAGNLSKIIAFFGHRDEPLRPLGEAVRNGVMAAGWLPARVLGLDLPDDGGIPFGMRWDVIPTSAPLGAWAFAAVQAACVIIAGIVALRRRDAASLALLGSGTLGAILAISSLRALVGEQQYSLLFWTTAASSVAWMGVLSTAGAAWAAADTRLEKGNVVRLAGVAALTLATACALVQCRWLRHYPCAPASDPLTSGDRRGLYEALGDLARRDGAIPVVHLEGAWDVAASIVLEYDRDGTDMRIADQDAWSFPGARLAGDAANVRHIWFSTPAVPLRLASCLDLVKAEGDISVFVARSDIRECPSVTR